jgi:hypothetical protein
VLGQVTGEDECGGPDPGGLDGVERLREHSGGVDAAGELLAVLDDVQVGELDERVGGGGVRHTAILPQQVVSNAIYNRVP